MVEQMISDLGLSFETFSQNKNNVKMVTFLNNIHDHLALLSVKQSKINFLTWKKKDVKH